MVMVMAFCCSGWDDCLLLPYFFRSLQGFLGDLVRSLGEDASLGDVLWTLDEHYGVMMTFNALSKEHYFLKQGMGENMAQFGVCLSQQVQILQAECPGRMKQQHMEEVKQDHFYESLSPEYQCMLAHKVDGKSPVTYSKLVLAAQKLERWVEVKDPLLPKTTPAGSSNITHSLSQRNLFPSRKLKSNHTFTAWSVAVEDHETEKDSGPKHKGEKEAKSSAEEDAGMTGEVGEVHPLLGYITQFANAVQLYQKRNHNCFRGGSPDHLVKDCMKELGKTAWKVGLNLKEGMVKKGRAVLSEVSGHSGGHPRWCSLSIKMSRKAPFLKPDPLMHWSWPDTIAQIKINEEGCGALLESGSTINAVTPEFIKACSLDMGPLSDLVDGTLKINRFRELFSWPLGYVRVQVEGVKGYDKDQVALVILDSTAIGARGLVILGMPTINQIVNVIKESKIDELSVSLNGLRISCMLTGHWVELSLKNNATASPTTEPIDLNEAVKTTKWEEVEAFSSKIVHSHTKTVLLGSNIYIMTQAPRRGKEPCLPHGLSVANTYTEMTTGRRCFAVLIKNHTAALIVIGKDVKVGWSRANSKSTHALLHEYHDIFSLEPGELGCTSLAKHEIRVADDEPFKERFWRIPTPMVEEVRIHVKEMLETGAICPSQNPWCNSVMLVRKKDRGLHFCINFCKLNVRTKKDSYP